MNEKGPRRCQKEVKKKKKKKSQRQKNSTYQNPLPSLSTEALIPWTISQPFLMVQ